MSKTRKKPKSITILLAIAALGVWGLIIYRVFNYMPETENQTIPKQFNNVSSSIEDKQLSYRLRANYPDPFLKTRPQKAKQTKINTNRFFQPPPEQNSIQWPKLAYLGTVKAGNAHMAFVRINGNETLVSIHDSLKSILILDFSDEKLIIQKRDSTRIIRKTE